MCSNKPKSNKNYTVSVSSLILHRTQSIPNTSRFSVVKILRLKAQTRSSWAPSCLWLHIVTLRPVYPDGHFSVSLSVSVPVSLSQLSPAEPVTERHGNYFSDSSPCPAANQHQNIETGPGCIQFRVWGIKLCVCVFMDVSLCVFSRIIDSWYQFQYKHLNCRQAVVFCQNCLKCNFYARKISRIKFLFSLIFFRGGKVF